MKPKTFLSYMLSVSFFLVTSTLAAEDEAMPEIRMPQYILHATVNSVFTLHGMKIHDTDSVEKSMESNLVFDAKTLFAILEHPDVTEKEVEKIYNFLILLSVMNEKFEIQQWRNDEELQSIFTKAQEYNPVHTEKMRCNNWNEAMWMGESNCQQQIIPGD